MKPTPPTVRALDADGSEFWMDANGLAWRADSSRVPELDGPAVANAVSVADTARALAGLWQDAGAHVGYAGTDTEYRRRLRIRRVAIEDAAHACGSQVYAAFNALVTGDATRAPGVGDA